MGCSFCEVDIWLGIGLKVLASATRNASGLVYINDAHDMPRRQRYESATNYESLVRFGCHQKETTLGFEIGNAPREKSADRFLSES